jgi:hypothetical protein
MWSADFGVVLKGAVHAIESDSQRNTLKIVPLVSGY